MTQLHEVLEAEFDAEVAAADVPVLLDFTATWCGPCKALTPALIDISTAFEGRARVVKIDIDRSPNLAERFGVRSVPTLVLMRDGEERERFTGVRTRSQLTATLERAIATTAQ